MIAPFSSSNLSPFRHQQHEAHVFGVVQGRSMEEPANNSIDNLLHSLLLYNSRNGAGRSSHFGARCQDAAALTDADLGIWANYIKYCLSDRRGTSTYDQSLFLFPFSFPTRLGQQDAALQRLPRALHLFPWKANRTTAFFRAIPSDPAETVGSELGKDILQSCRTSVIDKSLCQGIAGGGMYKYCSIWTVAAALIRHWQYWSERNRCISTWVLLGVRERRIRHGDWQILYSAATLTIHMAEDV